MTPSSKQSPIGSAPTRIDGPLKVSGSAVYTSDRHRPGMLYAVPVCATIARGRISELDDAAALTMPGVVAVLSRKNIGNILRLPSGSGAMLDEYQPPLQDDVIRYYGQYVALAVAATLEQAAAAAAKVRLAYLRETPNLDMLLAADEAPSVDTERGDPERAFAAAAVRLDETYTTPPETHNPIELNASVAEWEGASLTLHETSQAIVNHRKVLAHMLGVPVDKVRVVTEHLGAGFGGKLFPWGHSVLAAAAARALQRPVKLVLSRAMMFHNVGHRTNTQQRMRLSAGPDGRLTSLQHDYIYHVAQEEASKEFCGEATGYLYSTPNLRATAAFARRDIGPNTSMRGPGAVPGMFALESAMDELAIRLGMDPVRLRLLNEPEIDEGTGVPFSSRHLRECLRVGAERFGWDRRLPQVGAMRAAGRVLGWGMAASTWIAKRMPAEVGVTLHADGTARVVSATQDIGTGTYTVLAQMVAELTGIAIASISVVIGDTDLPPGPMSGGSMATASLVPAVHAAVRAAIGQALRAAVQAAGSPFAGADPAALVFAAGRVRSAGSAGAGLPFGPLLAAAGLQHVAGRGLSPGSRQDKDGDKVSIHSYGAHFVEVTWQPEIARLRISRVVTVIDAGKIVNPRLARNQIEGALIMGVGMALLEETHYERHSGAPVNRNLADYLMPTCADAPQMDVSFLDYPDLALNELGVRGVGEIGLAGFAPAVTAAVYHATGVRVRDLPVRIEDLL